MYNYEEEKYKQERDEANKKLRAVELELNTHKVLLQGFVDMVNESCESESLSIDDFMFYWSNAIQSGEEVFADQFSTLIMTAKMFFGEELHKIRVDEARTAAEYHKAMLKSQAEREARHNEYKQVLEIRSNERVLSIKKREDLLTKIFVSHSTLDDLPDEDIPHARALIESKHLVSSFWLGRLIVKSRDDVPPEHEEGYYEAHDHTGCPYTSGSNFYNMMARMSMI